MVAPASGIHEVREAADIIRRTADPEANIIFGAAIDLDMEDDIQITVIATGFDMAKVKQTPVTSSARQQERRRQLARPSFSSRTKCCGLWATATSCHHSWRSAFALTDQLMSGRFVAVAFRFMNWCGFSRRRVWLTGSRRRVRGAPAAIHLT